MDNSNEEQIVLAIRNKNEETLKELYRTNYPAIAHLVCSNNGSEQEAKDIYQQAVLIFYEKVQQAHFTLTCRIATYLYAVSRRLWLKRLTEKKRFSGVIDEGETFVGIHEEMEAIEEKERSIERMRYAMGLLGEPCRTIIEDFYVGDLSMEEISEKFGYTSADNAKNQKYKCLQRLKKIFFATNEKKK